VHRFACSLVCGLLITAALVAGTAGHAAPPQREVRGVWVVRTDLTSPQAVTRVVAQAKGNGLNTLFVQCRGRGDAYYADGLEPRAQPLEKAPPGFDPLARAVEEGHAAGLKVHAWVNSCYVWSEKTAPKSREHLVNAHRDWLAVDRNGRRCGVGDAEVFICPSHPDARAHLVGICQDVARRYALDGIQLDYIRYANANLCFCGGCLKRFEEYLVPKTTPERIAAARSGGRLGLVRAFYGHWGQFRRDQITTLVREIREAVKGERPGIQLTAAVIPWGRFPGDFRLSQAYNAVGQDWYGWIRAGLVDAVCPMTYQPGLAGFKGWVDGVQRDHPGFPVWYGIGAYLFPPQSAAQKVAAVRRAGGRGWVLFSYTAVTKGGADDSYLKQLKAKVLAPQTASTDR
jgi:uncharacterized lipoprotein YddW (UPF0748 family)